MPLIPITSRPEVFLSFEGVTGETTLPEDTVPPGPGDKWTPLVACRLEAEINVQSTAITRMSSNRVDFGGQAPPIRIAKLTDGATVGLMREILASKDLRAAVIAFVRTDNTGTTEYLRYELEACTIVSFDIVGVGSDRTAEEYGILYRKLTMIAFADGHGAKGARSTAVLQNGA